MHYVHLSSVKAVMQMRVEKVQGQAIADRLLRQLEFEQQGWLYCKANLLLRWLGHRLVLLGSRLERYAVAHSSA